MYSVEEIINAGAIYFKNIQEGFDTYDYQVVKMNRDEAYETITSLWISNGKDGSFVDFYYYQLEDNARRKVEAVLEKNEIQYLADRQDCVTDIIFPLDEMLINIIIKLNFYECLFSTFYFTKEPCTLWGNYNQEYVIFKHKFDAGVNGA